MNLTYKYLSKFIQWRENNGFSKSTSGTISGTHAVNAYTIC